jgi:hypothetical protein
LEKCRPPRPVERIALILFGGGRASPSPPDELKPHCRDADQLECARKLSLDAGVESPRRPQKSNKRKNTRFFSAEQITPCEANVFVFAHECQVHTVTRLFIVGVELLEKAGISRSKRYL